MERPKTQTDDPDSGWQSLGLKAYLPYSASEEDLVLLSALEEKSRFGSCPRCGNTDLLLPVAGNHIWGLCALHRVKWRGGFADDLFWQTLNNEGTGTKLTVEIIERYLWTFRPVRPWFRCPTNN